MQAVRGLLGLAPLYPHLKLSIAERRNDGSPTTVSSATSIPTYFSPLTRSIEHPESEASPMPQPFATRLFVVLLVVASMGRRP